MTSFKSKFKLSPEKHINKNNFFHDISIYDTGIKDNRIESLIVEKREKMLLQSLVPPEYTYVDEEGITRLKPHLYIKKLVVKPEYLRQGVCRNVEKQIVKLAIENGFEGRVLLDSSPIKGKESYIPSPTLAHWANGFRFYGSVYIKQMLDVINGIIPPEKAPPGCMYYPVK